MVLTPKQKAEELLNKYLDIENYNSLNLDLFCDECGMSLNAAKFCALIAVDEIIKIKLLWFQKDTEHLDFWKEVKEELLKIKN